MKYEDAVKLEELAAAVFDAKQVLDYQRARNIANMTIEEEKKSFIELTAAEAVFYAAEGKLRQAQGQMLAYGHLRDELDNIKKDQ